MFTLVKLYLLINTHNILVESLIPNLNVRKVDKKLIARKRQDTLDMCRMFTEGTEQMKNYNNLNEQDNVNTAKRVKRGIGAPKFAVNPALNQEDAKRVESIVGNLYDDIEEKGESVAYRHPSVPTTTVTVTTQNNNSRRSNFAPAELLGPLQALLPSIQLSNIPDVEPTDGNARWPYGIIPYFIDSRTYDADLAEIIMKAFDYFEKATCVRLQRLRERPTDKDSLKKVGWLYITNPSGIRQCVHSNERRKAQGVQLTVFGYDCMSPGDIAHEIMHILGFSHEHTRSDRDQYITILWDNIKSGYKKYFDVTKSEYQSIVESLPYDYASVLHYPARAFSKNGQVTVLTKPGVKIGQREGISETDVEKIGLVYSNECVKRNKEYLLKTCPSVVRADTKMKNVTQHEIEDYFRERLWPFGIINYKLRDKMDFSAEERENIKTVIRHIEKETCIEFRDITEEADDTDTQLSDHGGDKIRNHDPPTDAPTNNIPNHLANDPSENEIKQTDDENMNTISSENDIQSDQIGSNKVQVDEKSSANEFNKGQNETRMALRNKHEDKKVTSERKRVRRAALGPLPPRRHAASVLVLARNPDPGCICPSPGRPNGDKVLQINTDCFNSVNDLLHVFVHVLGLDHQHNMHDRDSYLHIVWDKLTPDIKEEMKLKLPPAASVGFPYDYQSVMHYPWLQIKNGVTNIMYPIWNDGWAMGHWQGLSSTDVQKLNLLYFNECVAKSKQETSMKKHK